MTDYPDTQLFIDGQWRDAADGRTLPVINPATEEEIGRLAHAGKADLDAALAAAERAFATWRKTSVFERYRILRDAASRLQADAKAIAALMTLEQGKPLDQAVGEVMGAADMTD